MEEKMTIAEFLKKYENAKKNDFTEDGSMSLKNEFANLWEDYISKNPFSHQSKIYLIQGAKFDSAELLWKYICEKNSIVDDAKKNVREEFGGDKENTEKQDKKYSKKITIPSHILELLAIVEMQKLQEKETSRLNEKIHSLENEIISLKNDMCNLNNIIDQKQSEIEDLKNEVTEQKALKSVIAKDEAQKVNETYKKLANELNYGYSMYLEAKEMEMSVDLGNVLRDTLDEVYAKLNSFGIKLGEQK